LTTYFFLPRRAGKWQEGNDKERMAKKFREETAKEFLTMTEIRRNILNRYPVKN